ARLLGERYADAGDLDCSFAGDAHARMAAHRSQRAYRDEPVPLAMVRALAAIALASPTKSDMPSRDIVIVTDPARRATLASLIAPDEWIAAAPVLLVFCGDHRRQRQLHEWRGHPFANDHLDWFFNATVDASIVLGAFVIAAEAAGLGCCPLSQIRNRAADVSAFLQLPERVFPVAGLTLGWPARTGEMSPRLPLALTVHVDRYCDPGEAATREAIDAHDRWRDQRQPYRKQRFAERLGSAAFYGWSEDKARQYSVSERADFGAFVRAKGFSLD
ncbi:MAG: nitroreductase family protein, partial [Proteobacteria bacterium]|nr:nitroreductase family protein [Burkholderiales bacterium]